MIESPDLRLIEAVARLGSLTHAGRELHLTPSALSHRLTGLERRLGLPLFVRAGKRMVPTAAGEQLRVRARDLIAGLAQALEEARAAGGRRRDVVRVSTECYTCYHWLPTVLREFAGTHPEGEVRIVAGATRRPIPALLAGKLDVGIVSRPVRDRRIVTTTLFEDEMIVVAAPGHPWAGRRWVDAADFAAERLISIVEPNAESDLFRELLEPAGVVPREVLEVHLTEAAVELVKAGLGVAVLARWAVAPQLAEGRLAAIRLTRQGFHRTWSAAALRQRADAPSIAAFVKALRRWSGAAVKHGAGRAA